MSTIPITQLTSWIHRELDKDLEKNIKTAQKLVKESLEIITDMTRKVKKLEEKATAELSKGSQQLVRTTRTRTEYKVSRHLANFAVAFQKLLSSINVPDIKSPTPSAMRQFHDSSVLFARDVKTLFSKFRTILYAPWIRNEARELQKIFVGFIRKRSEFKRFNDSNFSLNRDVEIFLNRLDQLQARYQVLLKSTQELHNLQTEEKVIHSRKQELKRQLEEIQSDSSFNKWEEIQRKQYTLEQTLQKYVSPLKRALRKIENQVDNVQSHFTPQALAQIGAYLETPYITFVADENGPNVLVEMAHGIIECIQTEKLVIDKSRGRKSITAAERVIQNKNRLQSLILDHHALEEEIALFRSSSTTKTLFNKISQLEEQSHAVDRSLRDHAQEIDRINSTLNIEQKLYDEQKNGLEQMIKALTRKSIKINNN